MTFLSTPRRPLPAKILIANRGEIAVRIIRACSDLGIASVAIYSPADRYAMHADKADESFALDHDAPEGSYLDIDQILAIAERARADAVHPGYGFLAENADFAERVKAAGLTWIGPSPDAIRTLGDKLQARKLAQQVGAPLVPGTDGPVSGVDEVLEFVDEHGFPIAIKAAYGGGGRGIKVVHDRESVPSAFDSAVRESETAFGRGECFVESFLATPRHVETQCVADEHGNVRVISTRDCSLQRRNQKLVEEAPAPTISEEQVLRLKEASIDILREAGYTGAGTCEFLVDGDRITFLEVNTRIQVEHSVTEEVSGIDLIAAMIKISSGAELGQVPGTRGHAIEFRINAEDVADDFSPAVGTFTRLAWPSGPGVRVDSGYREGDTVPTAYDSLIAKIIVTGESRSAAICRARRALSETIIEGVPTTIDFHRRIVEEEKFTGDDGRAIYTGWIGAHYKHAGDSVEVEHGSQPPLRRIVAEVDGRRLVVVLPGEEVVPADHSAASHERNGTTADGVRSNMGGTVVRVLAENGSSVEQGDTILILEAMKMERSVRAPYSGTVQQLHVAVGDTVQADAQICRVIAL